MTGLYPDREPYDAGHLSVGDGHSVYYEQSGNPDGLPVLFLHGGPGGGAAPSNRRYYDPDFYRLVMLDQRGCGRSTPVGSLKGNTTQNLIADLEKLRRHLKIRKWLVTGGSWGSFLSIAYGEAHPGACLGFVVRGVFMGRRHEIDWWFNGIGTFFPAEHAEFAAFVPAAERRDLLMAYYRRLVDPDPEVCRAAALALRGFSGKTQTFRPDPAHVAKLLEGEAPVALSRLFTHYCVNGCFVRPGQLLAEIGRIRHLPCIIVQGRYDVVTPPATAWDLKQAWPEAEFDMVTEASHTATEPALAAGLLDAIERMKIRLGSPR
ncbi:MAG: prolyl aminopeptidase [Thalassobaculales bacterium]